MAKMHVGSMSIQLQSNGICYLGRPVLISEVSGEMFAMQGLQQGFSARQQQTSSRII